MKMMKKVIYLIIAAISLLLVCCNNNNEPEQQEFVCPDRAPVTLYKYVLKCSSLTHFDTYYNLNGKVKVIKRNPRLNDPEAYKFSYANSDNTIVEPFYGCDSVILSNGEKQIVYRKKDNDKIFNHANYELDKNRYYTWTFTTAELENGTPVDDSFD